MDVYNRVAAKRDKILILADRFGIKNIRIFGSVARHEAHDRSDIDFLVVLEPGRSLLDLGDYSTSWSFSLAAAWTW